MSDYVLDLGSCCGCATTIRVVRTLGQLPRKAPIPGRGWGCLQCGLPPDGAQIVLCDICAAETEVHGLLAVVRWACRGYPASDGRVPIEELTGTHEHDLSRHPEVR